METFSVGMGYAGYSCSIGASYSKPKAQRKLHEPTSHEMLASVLTNGSKKEGNEQQLVIIQQFKQKQEGVI